MLSNYLDKFLLNKLNDIVFIFPIENGICAKFEQVNEKALEVLKYSQKELLSKNLSDISTLDKKFPMTKMLNSLLKDREIIFETTLEDREQNRVEVEFNISLFEKDNLLFAIAVGREIGKRKIVSDKFKKTFDMFELLSKNSLTAIGLYQEKFIYVNPTLEELTNYSKDELLKMSPIDFIHPNFKNRAKKIIDRISNGESFDSIYNIKIVTKDKKEKWVQVHSTTLHYLDKPTGLYNILDITSQEELKEKVKIENQKIKQKEELLAQQARFISMGEMIGSIAHQWKQPLTVIGLYNNSLREEAEVGEVERDLIIDLAQKIDYQIEFMSETINNFQSFLKPNKSKIEFNILQITLDTIKLLSAKLKNSSIDVKLKYKKDDWLRVDLKDTDKLSYTFEDEYIINGYSNDLKQILLNIISNAYDAIEINKIEKPFIDISLYKIDRELFISIKDNAGGVPKEIEDRIFESYFSTKDTKNGTGLGLYIAKTLAKNSFNGDISLNNFQNGAEFLIKLNLNN